MTDERYPASEPDVIDLGHRHFVRPNGHGGYLFWHDCTAVEHISWQWFGPGAWSRSGHVIENHNPLTVRGSLGCHLGPGCGDHGFIENGCWRPA